MGLTIGERPEAVGQRKENPSNSERIHQASEGRDAIGGRAELHAIFLFRDFLNLFS